MKTATYLRLSLLMPFVAWGICLLLLFIGSGSETNNVALSESTSFSEIVAWLFLAYFFGIIFWLFPYIVLAFMLLLWSFFSQARIVMKVFALSPIAMTVLIILWMSLLSSGNPQGDMFRANYQYFTIDLNALLAGITLVWGYLCVAAGFGIYVILRYFSVIRDEDLAIPNTYNELP